MRAHPPTAAFALLLCTTAVVLPSQSPAPADGGTQPTQPRHYEVQEHLELAYGDPDEERIRLQTLDLFVPETAEGESAPPLLVFFHGGSWRGGSPRYYRPVARTLAARGVAVALPGYRLSPAVQHPTHVRDCARSVAWLVERAERYGYDADHFAVGGHSAGAHLASLLATAPDYLAEHELPRDRVLGVIALSAPFDVCAPVRIFTSAFGDDRDDREEASPLRRDLEGSPPFLILWAQRDLAGLEMAARSMAKALDGEGIEHEARQIDGRDHVSIATRASQDGDPVTEAVLRFLQRQRPDRR